MDRSSETVAGVGVDDAENEQAAAHGDQDQVHHCRRSDQSDASDAERLQGRHDRKGQGEMHGNKQADFAHDLARHRHLQRPIAARRETLDATAASLARHTRFHVVPRVARPLIGIRARAGGGKIGTV
jgi:hypothetical protein